MKGLYWVDIMKKEIYMYCEDKENIIEVDESLENDSSHYVKITVNNKVLGYFHLECFTNGDDNILDKAILERCR